MVPTDRKATVIQTLHTCFEQNAPRNARHNLEADGLQQQTTMLVSTSVSQENREMKLHHAAEGTAEDRIKMTLSEEEA